MVAVFAAEVAANACAPAKASHIHRNQRALWRKTLIALRFIMTDGTFLKPDFLTMNRETRTPGLQKRKQFQKE